MTSLCRWGLLLALAALGCPRGLAQLGSGAATSMVAGVIKAANVRGDVRKIDLANQTESTLQNGDILRQDHAVVTKGAAASAVLVFANGATVRVGGDARLEIKEFMMDPLQADVASVAALTNEPTTSRTQLRLEFGEMVGNVKTLNRAAGSTFSVGTPAGAAGIRGTTFRIVYRPTGAGQAFTFQLSTAEGIVLYDGVAQIQPAAVNVPAGQEIIVVVQVDTATNSIVVGSPTAPPGGGMSNEAASALQTATVEIVQTQQQTTFTKVENLPAPPPPPPAPRTTPGDGR
ncbi:MAG: FecR domain-containing protein [Opitutaceae bacterium]